MLADPMLVAAGLQIVRAIGVKKLIPILAVGGLALGFLASRGQCQRGGSAGGVGTTLAFPLVVSAERGDDSAKTFRRRFYFQTATHASRSRGTMRPRFA